MTLIMFVIAALIASGVPAALSVLTARGAPLNVTAATYKLSVDRQSLRVTVLSAEGVRYTTFPLIALAGRPAMPQAAVRRLTVNGPVMTAEVLDSAGTRLVSTVLHMYAYGFTVGFTVHPGSDLSASPQFFYDGGSGLDLSGVTAGYSPDPGVAQHQRLPDIVTDSWTPLAPPPLDVEMDTRAGWFGIGMVQVPDATEMRVDPSGALTVNYPLQVLHSFPDHGAGGTVAGASLRFPTFVFTFAPDALGGLRAYRDALVALGAAPPAPSAGPAWWRQPIADTWGEQVAQRAVRGSRKFTTAWVQQFVQTWRARSGLSSFTVVIDARWQQQIGSSEPDVARFGGWSGMRRLIDGLHAQGLKVELWWPMWGRGSTGGPDADQPGHEDRADVEGPSLVVDPTIAGFEGQIASTMTSLLGSAPSDLNADGLKLDWAYNIPDTVSNPSLGWGDAVLYRYLSTVHTQGHLVRPDAYIESSAPSPQFATVADGVRLYDAWSERAWEQRAAIVAAVDPGALINGDGWNVSPADALVHTVTSSAYGVPASYFATQWADHSPIPPAFDRLLGAFMAVSQAKGTGTPARLQSGEWCFQGGSAIRAVTFANRTALLVWSAPDVAGTRTGQAVSGRTGAVTLPIAGAVKVTLTAPDGSSIAIHTLTRGISADLRAGVVYSVLATFRATTARAPSGCGVR